MAGLKPYSENCKKSFEFCFKSTPIKAHIIVDVFKDMSELKMIR